MNRHCRAVLPRGARLGAGHASEGRANIGSHLVVHGDTGYESAFRPGLYLTVGALAALVAAATALRCSPS